MPRSRRTFLRQLGGAGLLATAARVAGAEATARPPNIVHFMADELGYYELSCLGHPHFQTPHLDRLAAGGLRFTNGLAGCSVCAPTRCCLMTGKHSGHTSVRTNGGGTPLRAGEATTASVLRQAGYATGGFGKWGCGGRGSTGVPEEHGFDLFVGYYDQVHAHSYYPAYLVRNSEELPLPGNVGGRSGQTYSHYVIMDEARRFIRASAGRPFFCYLPVTPPHGMFDIPDDDPAWQLYRDRDWPEDARRYAAMVNLVDRNVGEVLADLLDLGLERDTLFVFSGDNGGMDYFRDDQHPRGFHAPNVDPRTGQAFRGQKGDLYEGGLRVPLLAYWPGRIQPGRVSEHVTYFPDWLPTLAELAGAEPPADVDGLSLVPELLGRPQPAHAFLYWELGRQVAVRSGSWKAVQPGGDRAWELYDLAADPGETNNLAAAQPDVLQHLQACAAQAHEPAVEGSFSNPALEDRDRRAKWGPDGPPEARVNRLPEEGLIPRAECRVVRASSESEFNGKLAANALDGDPQTLWHTRFQGGAVPHPHELVIDLGRERVIRGVRYLARQDTGWNGAVKDFELCVADTPDGFDEAAVKGSFRQVKTPQEVTFAPLRGRYVLVRALSEVNGGPWASVAEVGFIGE